MGLVSEQELVLVKAQATELGSEPATDLVSEMDSELEMDLVLEPAKVTVRVLEPEMAKATRGKIYCPRSRFGMNPYSQ